MLDDSVPKKQKYRSTVKLLDIEDADICPDFGNKPYQKMLLDKGLVHSTAEAAIEWANAMIPFNNK